MWEFAGTGVISPVSTLLPHPSLPFTALVSGQNDSVIHIIANPSIQHSIVEHRVNLKIAGCAWSPKQPILYIAFGPNIMSFSPEHPELQLIKTFDCNLNAVVQCEQFVFIQTEVFDFFRLGSYPHVSILTSFCVSAL